jgi:hypothetical protein
VRRLPTLDDLADITTIVLASSCKRLKRSGSTAVDETTREVQDRAVAANRGSANRGSANTG